MPICEYCGDEFTKGGAYTTHVRYCDARPDSEGTVQGDGGDTVSGEDGGDGSEEAVTVQISEDRTEDGSSGATAGEVADEDTATGGSPADSLGDDESIPGDGQLTGSDWPSHRTVAAGLVILALVIVWRQLSGSEDQE
jgi:hypothetical protein